MALHVPMGAKEPVAPGRSLVRRAGVTPRIAQHAGQWLDSVHRRSGPGGQDQWKILLVRANQGFPEITQARMNLGMIA